MKFLAKYFGTPSLFKTVQDFINGDMNSNFLTYFSDAYLYQDEAILQLCEEKSAKNFRTLDAETLCAIPPTIFQMITSSNHLKCNSFELSKRVVEYCRRNPKNINDEFLLSVADANVMPNIEPSVALHLLSLCYKNKCPDDFTESVENACVETACEDWDSFFRDVSPDDEFSSVIPDNVMIKLLKVGMRNAISENAKLKKTINNFHIMTQWGKSQIETRSNAGGVFPNTGTAKIKGIQYKKLDRGILEFQRFNQRYPIFYYKNSNASR